MINNFNNIVVSGYAAITPAGVGVEAVLQCLHNGTTALTDVPVEISSGHAAKWAHAEYFKASDYIAPMKARKMDRSSQFATATAGLAIKHAAIDIKSLDAERIGITMGCGFGGIGNSAEMLTGFFTSGMEGAAPLLFPNTVSNAAASNASIEHGLKGPNLTQVQRFCSAESALLSACRFIEEGRADIMLAGGIDELNALMMTGLISAGQHRRYAQAFGEGCGMLVLESVESARQRGATVLATINSVRSAGLLPQDIKEQGVRELLGDMSAVNIITLSGTVTDDDCLTKRLPKCEHINTAAVNGRGLAMGATAMAALVASLGGSQSGRHIAASPQGPYYAIDFHGAASA